MAAVAIKEPRLLRSNFPALRYLCDTFPGAKVHSQEQLVQKTLRNFFSSILLSRERISGHCRADFESLPSRLEVMVQSVTGNTR